MIKICCHSSKELEEIHRNIRQRDDVRLTKTHYVLRTEKNIFVSMPENPGND